MAGNSAARHPGGMVQDSPGADFRILGSLEILAAGRPLAITAPVQRRLLVALLLRINQVVRADVLVEELWPRDPPSKVDVALRMAVMRLRRLIAAADAGGHGACLVKQPWGYLLRLDPDRLDASRFERLAAAGQHALAEGDPELAAHRLRMALALWRGPALADLPPVPIVTAEAARLDRSRLAAAQALIDAELALGHDVRVLTELQELVEAHPLDEGLCERLIQVFYRSGRPAEALAAYRRLRRLLVDELGIEPNPRLQRLERAVLTADPSLEAAPPAAAPLVVPCHLPPDLADFTGRDELVDGLRRLLGRQADGVPCAPVVAIAGQAGIGKTALAVRVAHCLRDRYSDGQLFADLRGADLRGAEARPLEPAEVLAGFLRALGVRTEAIPAGLADRVGLYRSLLAGRRILVLLDNAVAETQVRPLLPASPGCAAIVTARRRLGGLEAARCVPLDTLAPAKSVELLGKIAGTQRVAADPDTAALIARQCGQLPLAIRIAGAKLASRPAWPLHRLAAQLADERHRLDALRVGDLEVRASLELSHRTLDPPHQRLLRLLGTMPMDTFCAWVAAALLDTGIRAGEQYLETLVDAQLVEAVGVDAAGQERYRLHDLVRLFARERAFAAEGTEPTERTEPAEASRTALARVLGGWLLLTAEAESRLPNRFPGILHGSAPRWTPAAQALPARMDPVLWFEIERSSLVAAVDQATELGLDELAWDLAGSLTSFLEFRYLWDDWHRTHTAALSACLATGNRRGEAALQRGLGELRLDQDDLAGAQAAFTRSRDLFDEIGEVSGGAYATYGLGMLERVHGRLDAAADHFHDALGLLRGLDDRAGEPFVLHSLGLVHLDQESTDIARGQLEQASAGYAAIGHRRGEAQVLHRLGALCQSQGQTDLARGYLNRALSTFKQFDDRLGTAYSLRSLGEIDLGDGDLAQADTELQAAREIFEEVGDGFGVAITQHTLGMLRCAQGRLNEALSALGGTLELVRTQQRPLWEARTLAGLDVVYERMGQPLRAADARNAAAEIFRALSAPASAPPSGSAPSPTPPSAPASSASASAPAPASAPEENIQQIQR